MRRFGPGTQGLIQPVTRPGIPRAQMKESTMAEQTKIFWFDLTTPDPQRAKEFYGALFGWTYTEQDRGPSGFYRMVAVDGKDIGGMVSMAELGMPEDDIPAHWMPYFFTNDVDGIARRAAELGGTVHGQPWDIPGVARLAVLGDPQNGAFAPMQPLMEGGDPSANPPVGGMIWYELQAPDQQAAATFYGDLFGLTLDHQQSPAGPYILLKSNGVDVGGVDQAQPGVPFAGWCPYIRVDDLEQTRARIVELGGQNLTDAFPVPDTGDMSLAMDPVGAVFGLLKPSWL
jgi:predicted enzyme related to lactoylglutathione lyase